MFRENVKHLIKDFFGLFNSMPSSMQEKALESEEHDFYNTIFCSIDEKIFAPLYSEEGSRPNSAINCLVASMILMNRRTWTYQELFTEIQFNLLARLALGLDDVATMPFCPATLFNFQNRLLTHYVKTGEDLIESVFDGLTQQQLKKFGLETNIQRTDSFLAASNVRDYSRIQLLVETIIRFYRVLSDADKEQFKEHFSDYIKSSSGQFIYNLKKPDIPHELQKLGQLYHWVLKRFKKNYSSLEIYQILKRVYQEHFTVVNKKLQVKSVDQLSSGVLQSPDDLESTFREKNGKKSKGRSVNVIETANPDNPFNLLTDVAVNPNNKDDSKALNERLDKLKAKTPDLDELHMDGTYGSAKNDIKFESHNITPVQTAVRGRNAAVKITIEQVTENKYLIKCPMQESKSFWARKRYKACFDLKVCSSCLNQDKCPTQKRKNNRSYYFDYDDYLRLRRLNMINKIPKERRSLRNNVEATINEFTCKMPRGKLKVRGTFKARIFAYTTAISINFGRIYRYNLQT